MLLVLAFVFLVLWLLGLFALHVTGWFIHVLIVLALVSFVVHLARRTSHPA